LRNKSTKFAKDVDEICERSRRNVGRRIDAAPPIDSTSSIQIWRRRKTKKNGTFKKCRPSSTGSANFFPSKNYLQIVFIQSSQVQRATGGGVKKDAISGFRTRVARFFLVHDTKTGKMYQMNTKCTK
jgi:hypothetical protein